MPKQESPDQNAFFRAERGELQDLFPDFEPFSVGNGNQLEPGASTVAYKELSLPKISLKSFQSDNAVQFRGRIPDNYTCFVLCPLQSTQGAQWSGTQPPPSTVAVFPPSSNHFIKLPAGWHDLELTVSNSALEKYGALPKPAPKTSIGNHYLLPDSTTISRSWTRLESLLEFAANLDGQQFTAQRIDSLSNLLMEEVAVLVKEPVKTLPYANSHNELVQQAIEQISSSDPAPSTASEVSDLLSTNRWTLQRSFKESLGLSPYQFLICYRLNQARQKLLKGSSDNIADLAVTLGFASGSSFAAQYRKFFGETPSDTLSRNSSG